MYVKKISLKKAKTIKLLFLLIYIFVHGIMILFTFMYRNAFLVFYIVLKCHMNMILFVNTVSKQQFRSLSGLTLHLGMSVTSCRQRTTWLDLDITSQNKPIMLLWPWQILYMRFCCVFFSEKGKSTPNKTSSCKKRSISLGFYYKGIFLNCDLHVYHIP